MQHQTSPQPLRLEQHPLMLLDLTENLAQLRACLPRDEWTHLNDAPRLGIERQVDGLLTLRWTAGNGGEIPSVIGVGVAEVHIQGQDDDRPLLEEELRRKKGRVRGRGRKKSLWKRRYHDGGDIARARGKVRGVERSCLAPVKRIFEHGHGRGSSSLGAATTMTSKVKTKIPPSLQNIRMRLGEGIQHLWPFRRRKVE